MDQAQQALEMICLARAAKLAVELNFAAVELHVYSFGYLS
jgi:hypothetical protein